MFAWASQKDRIQADALQRGRRLEYSRAFAIVGGLRVRGDEQRVQCLVALTELRSAEQELKAASQRAKEAEHARSSMEREMVAAIQRAEEAEHARSLAASELDALRGACESQRRELIAEGRDLREQLAQLRGGLLDPKPKPNPKPYPNHDPNPREAVVVAPGMVEIEAVTVTKPAAAVEVEAVTVTKPADTMLAVEAVKAPPLELTSDSEPTELAGAAETVQVT